MMLQTKHSAPNQIFEDFFRTRSSVDVVTLRQAAIRCGFFISFVPVARIGSKESQITSNGGRYTWSTNRQ
ncbi:unnamed protein product [Pseudo-nitzschia multistriata]|uniref:Uncharacterized protein n=1 Tax=Pseudo-nitzschia multistriata TaxID=183589 RepID=A0A448ZGH8_9STRA|nr:unnamed protein product [Pseudo-nitzschia multistriata]